MGRVLGRGDSPGWEGALGKCGFGALLASTGLAWGKAAFGGDTADGERRAPSASAVDLGVAGAANAFLAGLLVVRWVDSGHFPLSNLYESLIFLSWSITSVQLYLTSKVSKSVVPGAVAAPAALLALAGATLLLPPELQRAGALVPALKSNWLIMHVTVMMFSYGTLMVGSLMGGAFLVLDQPDESAVGKVREAVKAKIPALATVGAAGNGAMDVEEAAADAGEGDAELRAVVAELSAASPAAAAEIAAIEGGGSAASLTLAETVDDIAYRSLGLGFVLLTVGIISGAVWANEAWGSYWSWDPKETWALITWLTYAGYMHTRLTAGWSKRDVNAVAASGFFVTWVTYIGVNLFGLGLHSYGFLK
eukprot:PRCOL_00005002-RA